MIKTYKADHRREDIVINELNIRAADRGRKDIQTWRGALISAESIRYPNRTRLYDLYEDVMLDGHLSGVIAKRIDAILNKEIFFEVVRTGKLSNHFFTNLAKIAKFYKEQILYID
jgi:hypothetical protein